MRPAVLLIASAALATLGAGPAAALSLNQWLKQPEEARGYYLAGVLDALIYDRSHGPGYANCVAAWGIDGAFVALMATAAQQPALGGFNAAGLVAIAAEAACGGE